VAVKRVLEHGTIDVRAADSQQLSPWLPAAPVLALLARG